MATVTATYTLQEAASFDLLQIEQTEWQAYTGALSAFGAAAWIAGLLYDTAEDVEVECGFDGNRVVTGIACFPYRLDIDYKPHLTHGELGDRIISHDTITESIAVSLDTRLSLKYPARRIISATWQGACYDDELHSVPRPVLTIDQDDVQEILADRAVYGTVVVQYETIRHSYTVSIPLRDDAEMNKYSSVFYAVYDGGVQYHRLSTPPGADEFEGDCGGGHNAIKIDDTDDDDPALPDPYADRTTVYDYCDGSIISDDVVGV